MQLTREADYAIRMVLEVASRSADTPTTTAVVAQRRLVPRPMLRKLVPRLVGAGVLRTRRGADGGLLLARPAGDITLLAVIDSAQGPIAFNRCVLRPDICALQPTCPVHEVCRLARDQIVRLLGDVTFADLTRRQSELRSSGSRLATDGGEGTA